MVVFGIALAFLFAQRSPQAVPEPPSTPVTSSGMGEYWHGEGNYYTESTVTATFTLGPPTPDQRQMTVFTCYSDCLGTKQQTHDKCTTSCDRPCFLRPHVHEVPSVVDISYDGPFRARSPVELDLAKTGVRGFHSDMDASSTAALEAVQKILAPYRKITRTVQMNCFADPCSKAQAFFSATKIDIIGHYHTKLKVSTDGKNWTTSESDAEGVAASVYVADTATKPRIVQTLACSCDKAVPRTATGSGLTPLSGASFNVTKLENSYCFLGGLSGVTFTPPAGAGSGQMYVPAGMELIPRDSSSQRLVILYGSTFGFDTGARWGTWGGRGPAGGAQSTMLRVACIDMNKEMPQDQPFKVQPIKDDVLQSICQMDADAPVHGLYDQPRVWIYTDHATIDEINKHLMRHVTPSVYLRAIWQDWTVGGVNLQKPEFQKCLDPRLLEGINAPAEAKQWLVASLDAYDPKGLVREMKTNAAAFQSMIKDSEDAQNMADLIDALAHSSAPEVTLSLDTFMRAAIPADKLEEVAGRCKHLMSRAQGA